MRFSIAAAAFLATAVSAGSVVYETEVITVTSCKAEVTDCPAESTVVSTTSYIATTTPVSPPVYGNSSVVYHPTTPVYTAPTTIETHVPETHVPETHVPGTTDVYHPEVPKPTEHLSTVTISTCVPTVITSVITVTPKPSAPAEETPYVPGPPAGPGSNGTAPVPTGAYPTGPVFEGSASSIKMSAFAAVFGLAAFLL